SGFRRFFLVRFSGGFHLEERTNSMPFIDVALKIRDGGEIYLSPWGSRSLQRRELPRWNDNVLNGLRFGCASVELHNHHKIAIEVVDEQAFRRHAPSALNRHSRNALRFRIHCEHRS